MSKITGRFFAHGFNRPGYFYAQKEGKHYGRTENQANERISNGTRGMAMGTVYPPRRGNYPPRGLRFGKNDYFIRHRRRYYNRDSTTGTNKIVALCASHYAKRGGFIFKNYTTPVGRIWRRLRQDSRHRRGRAAAFLYGRTDRTSNYPHKTEAGHSRPDSSLLRRQRHEQHRRRSSDYEATRKNCGAE